MNNNTSHACCSGADSRFCPAARCFRLRMPPGPSSYPLARNAATTIRTRAPPSSTPLCSSARLPPTSGFARSPPSLRPRASVAISPPPPRSTSSLFAPVASHFCDSSESEKCCDFANGDAHGETTRGANAVMRCGSESDDCFDGDGGASGSGNDDDAMYFASFASYASYASGCGRSFANVASVDAAASSLPRQAASCAAAL